MSRIVRTFAELGKRDNAALVTFITAGDPAPGATVPLMHTLADAGADIIELGVPFSDPMADGPVIQEASERALSAGVGTTDVLAMVREFRLENTDTPVVLMGYLNPIEAMGYESFCEAFSAAGVDGIIIVDMPPEEGADLDEILRRHGIDRVFLLAPTSTPERIGLICDQARGFIYYVSLRGVTGSAGLDVGEIESRLAEIKQRANLPVGVGFGIDNPAKAAAVARIADAVIVGSALVRLAADSAHDHDGMLKSVAGFIRDLSTAVKQARIEEPAAT